MATDERPELGAVAVGRSVIVAQSNGRRMEYVPATVVRVARVWIDVEPENGHHLNYYNRRFRMDSQYTGKNGSARFHTLEQYAWDLRQTAAHDYVRAQGLEVGRYDPSPWKGRELELANVLRAHEGLEPL